MSSAQGLAGYLGPGPLSEPHAELDTVTQCPACHEPGAGVAPDRCMVCHETVRDQVHSGTGFHADKGTACQACHPDHQGRDHPLLELTEATFDHGPTGFPLDGPHQAAPCSACHQEPGTWIGLQRACTSCHDDVHGSERPALARCDDCHAVVDDWKVPLVPATVFDHTDPGQVDWLLEGAHLEVGCTGCHVAGVFAPTEAGACTDCHTDPHRTPFVEPCASCHAVVADFRVPDFDHRLTRWPLHGRHLQVACEDCHGEHATEPLAHDACADCHADPHRGQFRPRPCDACHTLSEAAFRIARFDHERTAFPLRGRHATVLCDACHGERSSARYAGLSHDDCDACHLDIHDGRFEPTLCGTCHTDEGWAVDDFDHARAAFPLEGRHADVPCASCHPDAQWNGVAFDTCATCHAEQDPHQGRFAPAACDDCHRPTGWADQVFDHAGGTAFPLAPQHEALACAACHPSVTDFGGLGTTCAGCHEDRRPGGHYDGACEGCHGAPTWIPADLDDRDHAITGFPLEGVHGRLPCEACHAPGHPRAEAVGTCVACHATDDAHRHRLGDACGDCHAPTSWVRTRFRHFSTGWPLRGAHRLVACDGCHAATYVATPRDCATCHAGQASQGVAAHRSSFFLGCEECHQPYTWSAPGFPH